jgi:septum formation inhibitor MinC
MTLDLRRSKKDFEVNEVDPISKACQDYLKSEDEINNLELMLKSKKESLRQQNELIVQLMEERGVRSIKMKDGQSVDIKPFYTGTITKEKQQEAFQWLRDNGYDDIIKNQVVVKFGRAEDEKANNVFTELANKGLDTDRNVKVEPMTLKGFIREMIESGKELPMETFGVFVGHKINIKKGK